MTDMAVKRGRDEERKGSEEHEAADNVRAENLIGIAAVVVLIAASLARTFGGPPSLYRVTAGAALLLIAAGYRRINPKLRNTSFVLLTAGALALPWARDPSSAIQRGVFVAGLLLSLTASVMLIARCAMQSRRIHAIGAGLRERVAHRDLRKATHQVLRLQPSAAAAAGRSGHLRTPGGRSHGGSLSADARRHLLPSGG